MIEIVNNSTRRRIKRGADAEPAGTRLLFLRQLVGEYRNEDEIVDAEHHFHHDKRDKGYEAGWRVDEIEIGD